MGIRATQGLVLLERAERTGDTSRIAEANELIELELDSMDPDSIGGVLHHGGPLVLLTAYLRYADRPDLLDPAFLRSASRQAANRTGPSTRRTR